MGVKKIKDIDNTKNILKAIDFLSNNFIEIGIFETKFKDSEGNLTIFGKAVVNEYGATIEVTDKMRAYLHHIGIHLKTSTKDIVIPERSFIRASFDSNRQDILRSIEELLDEVISGKLPVEKFMAIVGESGVRTIREYIQKGVSPKNSPITLANKKGNKPLIDTTELINNLDWRIVRAKK